MIRKDDPHRFQRIALFDEDRWAPHRSHPHPSHPHLSHSNPDKDIWKDRYYHEQIGLAAADQPELYAAYLRPICLRKNEIYRCNGTGTPTGLGES